MKKIISGTIAAVIDDRSARVTVLRYKTHSKYPKQFRVTKAYLIDTTDKKVAVGDTVSFEECRPLSKRKSWRMV